MRILMFFTIFILLAVLVAELDSILYKSSFMSELRTLLVVDPGSNKWMVYVFLVIGFLYSFISALIEKLQKLKKMGSFK